MTVAVLLAGLGLGAGATALAQGGDDPYSLREPAVTSGGVLDLPSGCLRGTRVIVRINPPPGAVLSWLRVRADGRESVKFTGVPRAASATVRLGPRGGTVSVTGQTLGGQQIAARRHYRPCRPAPAPAPPPPAVPGAPPVSGGGEG